MYSNEEEEFQDFFFFSFQFFSSFVICYSLRETFETTCVSILEVALFITCKKERKQIRRFREVAVPTRHEREEKNASSKRMKPCCLLGLRLQCFKGIET